jgi:hypothetical protein
MNGSFTTSGEVNDPFMTFGGAAAGRSATISSADEPAGRSRAGETRLEESPDSTGQGGC